VDFNFVFCLNSKISDHILNRVTQVGVIWIKTAAFTKEPRGKKKKKKTKYLLYYLIMRDVLGYIACLKSREVTLIYRL
jgi:hypothetical protein